MSKSLSNKKTKKFADFVETENPQLSLFTLLEDDRDDYSHTIELYDFLPKFVFGVCLVTPQKTMQDLISR